PATPLALRLAWRCRKPSHSHEPSFRWRCPWSQWSPVSPGTLPGPKHGPPSRPRPCVDRYPPHFARPSLCLQEKPGNGEERLDWVRKVHVRARAIRRGSRQLRQLHLQIAHDHVYREEFRDGVYLRILFELAEVGKRHA